MTRIERFKALMDEYQQSPTDYDEGEEEDPRPYFNGEREPEQFACVTVNYSAHGEAKFFFLLLDSRQEAQDRAALFAQDDLFEELPVTVVDLDTGKRSDPVWTTLRWTGDDEMPEPPEDLADAWRRYQAGEDVTEGELRQLDEWRADAREDALGW